MSGESENNESTAVTIFGRTYQLRGNEDPDYLGDLASLVDRKMRDVVEATGTADSLKVAILAALNIADENLLAQGGGVPRRPERPRKDEETAMRVGRMVAKLDEALAG